MKRYLLFTGPNDYPKGGFEDFEGSFDTIDEALAAYQSNCDLWVDAGGVEENMDWYHIFDLCNYQIVDCSFKHTSMLDVSELCSEEFRKECEE